MLKLLTIARRTHFQVRINLKIYYLFWTDLSVLDGALLFLFENIWRKFIFSILPLTLITLGEAASTKIIVFVNINRITFLNLRYGSIAIIIAGGVCFLLCSLMYLFVFICLINYSYVCLFCYLLSYILPYNL